MNLLNLAAIREAFSFKKKKDLSNYSKRYYRTYTKTGLETQLPTSGRFGLFTSYFIKQYAPEKNYLRNVHYCFDRGDKLRNHAGFEEIFMNHFAFWEEEKEVVVKNKKVAVTFKHFDSYKPEEVIQVFANHPELVLKAYAKLKKFMHKELAYKDTEENSLLGQERVLAILLARLDACDFDLMAIPTKHAYFDNKPYGFSTGDWCDVLNVFICNNYFLKTHGDGSRKGANIVTLGDNQTSPETFDEANYVPSFLIPDYKMFHLFRQCNKVYKKEVKKTSCGKNLEVMITGTKRKIPVAFVNDGLSPEKQFRVDKMNRLPGYVCRRSISEFAENLNNLGFYFSNGTDLAIANQELMNFYKAVEELAENTRFQYSAVIHLITRKFREICKNLKYCRGAFKWSIQYIMFGQTNNKIMNKNLGLK